MRKRSTRRPRQVERAKSRQAAASAARLEDQRAALLDRLARLQDHARLSPGHRTALRLLNPMFRKASLTARAAILQAAGFMIDILEMTPPFL